MIVIVSILSTTLVANAASKYAESGTQYLLWSIAESDDVGAGLIVCGADCLANYFETYTNTSSSVTLTKHELFACAQNWEGAFWGYDLYAQATSVVKYYNSSGTSVGSVSLSTYNNNVLVDPDWIWDDEYSTKTVSVSSSSVKGKVSGYFYCPDAFLVNTKEVPVSLTCP